MDCKQYRKTVDPTCESHKECEWVPGNRKQKTKGFCRTKHKAKETKPSTKPTTKPTTKTVKTNCRQYLKTKPPKCELQPGCVWIPGNRRAKTKGFCREEETDTTSKHTKEPKTDKVPESKVSPIPPKGKESPAITKDGFGPLIKKITGIYQLSYFDVLPGDRKILLLGEDHTIDGCATCQTTKGCMRISKYLDQLDKAKRECIDVFLESYKKRPKRIPTESSEFEGGASSQQKKSYRVDTVNSLRTIFSDLPFSVRRDEDSGYPYLRIHDWDLRQLYCGGEEIRYCQVLRDSFVKIWLEKTMIITETNRQNITNYINNYPGTIRDKARLFFDYYVTGYKLKKAKRFVHGMIRASAYYITPEQEIRDYTKFTDYTRYKIQKELRHVDPALNKYIGDKSILERYFDIWFEDLQETGTVVHKTKQKIYGREADNFLIAISLLLTDIYLFCRMFRRFDKKKRTDGKGCYHQKYPKNIIVYGGGYHTQMIKLMIKDIFGDVCTIEKEVPLKTSCIKFKKPVQFF